MCLLKPQRSLMHLRDATDGDRTKDKTVDRRGPKASRGGIWGVEDGGRSVWDCCAHPEPWRHVPASARGSGVRRPHFCFPPGSSEQACPPGASQTCLPVTVTREPWTASRCPRRALAINSESLEVHLAVGTVTPAVGSHWRSPLQRRVSNAPNCAGNPEGGAQGAAWSKSSR